MDDIGLRCILRVGRVPYVLGRTKDSMGKGIKELSLAEDTVGWPQSEPCFGSQIVVQVSQLRNRGFKVKVLLQLLHLFFIPLTHAGFMQFA